MIIHVDELRSLKKIKQFLLNILFGKRNRDKLLYKIIKILKIVNQNPLTIFINSVGFPRIFNYKKNHLLVFVIFIFLCNACYTQYHLQFGNSSSTNFVSPQTHHQQQLSLSLSASFPFLLFIYSFEPTERSFQTMNDHVSYFRLIFKNNSVTFFFFFFFF